METKTMLYVDTNILRYFATAFAESTLDGCLRDRLLLPPISVIELLSQLTTERAGAAEALAAFQAMPRVFNPQHTGILPWSDDFFRMAVFNVAPEEDTITRPLNHAINNCLNAESVDDLKAYAEEILVLLDKVKVCTTKQFSDVVEAQKAEGKLSEQTHRVIFARSIARRAKVPEADVDVDGTVQKLDALYRFEKEKLTQATGNYKPDRHANDFFDAELLVYLADPKLHLLTSDRGFTRVGSSCQVARIHIESPECMLDKECAAQAMRGILTGQSGLQR